MYDEIEKEVSLTADEIDLIRELLIGARDGCVSIGEGMTVQELLDKLAY